MKIGILTLPLHRNYGGILQAYALQTILQRMGHGVVVFNKDRFLHFSLFRQMLSFSKYCIRSIFTSHKVKYISPREYNEQLWLREQNLMTFIKNDIKTINVKHLNSDVPDDIDAIVVGSDQVWRRPYFMSLYSTKIENAFLEFLQSKNIIRLAYAASFGTDVWEYSDDETQRCASLLKLFDAVSVRENSGVQLCENKLGRTDVECLLDPTMLLTKEDYIRLVVDSNTAKSKGNLLCYILDNNDAKQSLINKIASERNLNAFRIFASLKEKDGKDSEPLPSIAQWLRGFLDSEFVITDSFHACVFSIIFNKPFLVIGNRERGIARFETLLSTFSLTKNMIFDVTDYDSTYGYNVRPQVNDLLEKERYKSMQFLKRYLN